MKLWGLLFFVAFDLHATAPRPMHDSSVDEAPATLPLETPLCLTPQAAGSELDQFCTQFCTKTTTPVANKTLKHLVRRELSTFGRLNYFRNLFAASRASPPLSANRLTVILGERNQALIERKKTETTRLADLEKEVFPDPKIIDAKIAALDLLGKTPHKDKDGNWVRSGLDDEEQNTRSTLLAAGSTNSIAKLNNKAARVDASTTLRVIKDLQLALGGEPSAWKTHATIANAYVLSTSHGEIIFEFSDATQTLEPVRISLQTPADTSPKMLCDNTKNYLIEEKFNSLDPPVLTIEHFQEWNESLSKTQLTKGKIANFPPGLNYVMKMSERKGATELCEWIQSRKPTNSGDLRRLQVEYFSSLYNTLYDMKESLERDLSLAIEMSNPGSESQELQEDRQAGRVGNLLKTAGAIFEGCVIRMAQAPNTKLKMDSDYQTGRTMFYDSAATNISLHSTPGPKETYANDALQYLQTEIERPGQGTRDPYD